MDKRMLSITIRTLAMARKVLTKGKLFLTIAVRSLMLA